MDFKEVALSVKTVFGVPSLGGGEDLCSTPKGSALIALVALKSHDKSPVPPPTDAPLRENRATRMPEEEARVRLPEREREHQLRGPVFGKLGSCRRAPGTSHLCSFPSANDNRLSHHKNYDIESTKW